MEDTGIGIAPKHFDLIFDQFRQVDGSDTRKFGGTGLGLAICKNLVSMMGGRIWVESEANKGAIFQVELPLRSPLTSKPDSTPTERHSTASEVNDQLRIMVVDDEPDALVLMREMLHSLGHHVIVADSGYAALKLMEQSWMPDLILMDVQMPVLSGTETLRIIRERYKGIRVVAQSAHALMGDRDRFLKEGFDEYLPKPFKIDQIAEVISILSKG